jgi:hypothetical protein
VATKGGASPRLSQRTVSRWPLCPRLVPFTIATLVLLALASDWHTLRLMIARRYYAGDVLHVAANERRFDAIRPHYGLIQLGTSLPRLLTQLWPAVVLLFGLVVQSPTVSADPIRPPSLSGSYGDPSPEPQSGPGDRIP